MLEGNKDQYTEDKRNANLIEFVIRLYTNRNPHGNETYVYMLDRANIDRTDSYQLRSNHRTFRSID